MPHLPRAPTGCPHLHWPWVLLRSPAYPHTLPLAAEGQAVCGMRKWKFISLVEENVRATVSLLTALCNFGAFSLPLHTHKPFSFSIPMCLSLRGS